MATSMLNLGKRKHKLGLITLLGLFAFLFLHNAWLYSPFGGYDKSLHMAYAKILTFEHRIQSLITHQLFILCPAN